MMNMILEMKLTVFQKTHLLLSQICLVKVHDIIKFFNNLNNNILILIDFYIFG